MDSKQYAEYIDKHGPRTNEWVTLLTAFGVGGLICMIGQAFGDVYKAILPEAPKAMIGSLTSATMIFLGAFLTGLGIYDKIGSVAGAGSIIPITGFANSITSPATEFRKEGIVFGLMGKMFVMADPVILTGIVSSVTVGFIYWIVAMIG